MRGKVRLAVGTQMHAHRAGLVLSGTLTLQGFCPWGALGPRPQCPIGAGSGDAAGRIAPAARRKPRDPPAQCWVLAGLDPPHCHPPLGGGGRWPGGTGSPVGSDFSPGSSARLPPHSCPLLLLLLAGEACPSSGPTPGTWPSSPRAAPVLLPCTALRMPSASLGPRGVMSGETPKPPTGLPRKGGGGQGTAWAVVVGGVGRELTCSPHATVRHPSPASCHCTALSRACLLFGSRQEGAVALLGLARS